MTKPLRLILPTSDVGNFIKNLAHEHGVTYVKTANDHLANVITSLSDDSVVLSEPELLIIALEREGVIAREDVVPLQVNFLKEVLDV